MDPFVAEIRIFPFNFPPKGWAFCDGQLLPISQNTALFSLVGTFYGGNGTSTFGLPNMQGNAPMHPGQGPGLSDHVVGETSGSETVTLLQSEIPAHSHTAMASSAGGGKTTPGPTETWASAGRGSGNLYATVNVNNPALNTVNMSPSALAPGGSGFPHNNLMPYLTLNFCIALQGVYPARN